MKKSIHFVGIGGIGVSSLARHFFAEGFKVTGSDLNSCPELEDVGMTVFRGHSEENLSDDVDLLIYSNAISKENPEIKKAKKIGILTQSSPEALGELTKKYYTIAVSGTHGKSTTTSMMALVMIAAGLDPTVIVGTKLKEFNGTNYRRGKSKYLLIEADEWKASLLNYYPEIAIITNIEEDHLDFYPNIESIIQVFNKYVRSNLKEGTLILNEDDENSLALLEESIDAKIVKYGMKRKEKLKLSVPGKHNLYNALAVFSASRVLGIKKDTIRKGLENFKGTWRRFEEKNIELKNGKKIKVINDYAHHPTEVRATLEAAREKYPQEKITALFQPHQYERTYRLFSSFVSKLQELPVDRFLITDIYTVPGREAVEIKKKVNAEMLRDRIENSVYVGDLKKAENYLLEVLQENEILIIMGAGDIYHLIDIISS